MSVALLPGPAFGRRGDGHVRLSFAAAPVPVIERAVERLADLVRRWGGPEAALRQTDRAR